MWVAVLVVRRRRCGGVDGDVLLILSVCGAKAARRVSIELDTPASHGLATAIVKTSFVATYGLGLAALRRAPRVRLP